jgi:UDP-N-acetylglucosamine/UDP-N-acetylgalactosamine diphosphorylase
MIEKRLKELGQKEIINLLRIENGPVSEELMLRDLEGVDTELFARLVRGDFLYTPPRGTMEPEEAIPAAFAQTKEALACRKEGQRLLKEGKVAALVVAGGQGSRLGVDGPKGIVGVTPVKRKSLFRVFAEKILALEKKIGCKIPFFIMTSRENRKETEEYFQANAFLGLDRSRVYFFVQGMLPSITPDGSLIISEQGGISINPDGHGGTFRALKSSGYLEMMKKLGVEEIFYFQVDNPLVKICDPLFLGIHRLSGAHMSSKVVRKATFGEKVGVLAKIDGKTHLVEYSDMDDSMRYAVSTDGSMLHWAGNIAVHMMRRDFIERITSGDRMLPFHRARKSILSKGPDGRSREIEGIKFEAFLFDALPLAEKTTTLEVNREEEFAPVKNRTGTDSLESSITMQNSLYRTWLENIGIKVKPGINLEISPFLALDEGELRKKASILPEAIEEDTFLEQP